jgi:TPR repeat protein
MINAVRSGERRKNSHARPTPNPFFNMNPTNLSLLLAFMVFVGTTPGRAQCATSVPGPSQPAEGGTPPVKPASRNSALVSLVKADWKSIRLRAEGGDAASAYELGRRYEHGIGMRPNARQALRWYRDSAGRHFAKAQYSLGRLLASGEAGRVEYTEALKWFRRAAAQDHALAQNRLGVMYQRGQGVAPDAVEAFRWFTLAARTGEFGPAAANLHALSAKLTPKQLAQAAHRAGSFP